MANPVPRSMYIAIWEGHFARQARALRRSDLTPTMRQRPSMMRATLNIGVVVRAVLAALSAVPAVAEAQATCEDSTQVMTAVGERLQKDDSTLGSRRALVSQIVADAAAPAPGRPMEWNGLVERLATALGRVSFVPPPRGSEAERLHAVRAAREYDIVWMLGSVTIKDATARVVVYTTRYFRPHATTFSVATREIELTRNGTMWRVTTDDITSIADGDYRVAP